MSLFHIFFVPLHLHLVECAHIMNKMTNDIPAGHTKEDIKAREKLIKDFYAQWIAEHPEKKIWNQSKFTIKKYTSEWTINEDGEREQSKIVLLPQNTDGYEPIPLDKDEPEPHYIVGVFKTVIK